MSDLEKQGKTPRTLVAALECAVETARTSARNDNGTWFLKAHGEALLNAVRRVSELEAKLAEAAAAEPAETVLKTVQRVLDENSAWIAMPNREVEKKIAIAVGFAASVAQEQLRHELMDRAETAERRVSELEAAIAPAIAEAERANRLGADKLRSTEINAQYWLEGGRRTANRGEAVFAVEQAMNAYSNAAYGLAEDLAKAEVKLAEKSKEVARWEKMYVCAQNSNSFRQDALDGK